MGGYGSGSHQPPGKRRTGSVRAINVNLLNKKGALASGAHTITRWLRDGEEIGSVSIKACDDEIFVSYVVSVDDGPAVDVLQPVHLNWRACRFGGRRPFFVCPGGKRSPDCGRNVLDLYIADAWPACRNCCRLCYSSQMASAPWRAQDRMLRAKRRLDPGADMHSLPSRPKGMWRQTYERKLDHIIELEEAAEEAFLAGAVRVIARMNKRAATSRGG